MKADLHSKRCGLRLFSEKDAKALYFILKDKDIAVNLKNLGRFDTIEDVKHLIRVFNDAFATKTGVLWKISCEGYSDSLIGFVGLCDLAFVPVVFFALAKRYRNRGIMTECVTEVLKFVENAVSKNIVRTIVEESNISSFMVLKNNGFVLN